VVSLDTFEQHVVNEVGVLEQEGRAAVEPEARDVRALRSGDQRTVGPEAVPKRVVGDARPTDACDARFADRLIDEVDCTISPIA
jgi:hypothetical protein